MPCDIPHPGVANSLRELVSSYSTSNPQGCRQWGGGSGRTKLYFGLRNRARLLGRISGLEGSGREGMSRASKRTHRLIPLEFPEEVHILTTPQDFIVRLELAQGLLSLL